MVIKKRPASLDEIQEEFSEDTKKLCSKDSQGCTSCVRITQVVLVLKHEEIMKASEAWQQESPVKAIDESTVEYGDFGSQPKCIIFYYTKAIYGPHRLLCLNKPMGARE